MANSPRGTQDITRQGGRTEVPFFEAKGISPAAGYASSVDDLAKFAMWQFRLRGDTEELVHAYTLAEMQRVHFARPGSNTMRGLGFSGLGQRRRDIRWPRGELPRLPHDALVTKRQ